MTCIPAYAQPAIVEYLAQRKANGDEDAARLLGKLPTKGVKKHLDLPGKSKAERKAEHQASTGDLRGSALARSEGRCEACFMDIGVSWELHHVLSGGQRRARQALGNVVCLCFECHRRCHRNDLGTLAQIARSPVLDADARRAVTHRINKLLEARRATP